MHQLPGEEAGKHDQEGKENIAANLAGAVFRGIDDGWFHQAQVSVLTQLRQSIRCGNCAWRVKLVATQLLNQPGDGLSRGERLGFHDDVGCALVLRTACLETSGGSVWVLKYGPDSGIRLKHTAIEE